MNMLSVAPEGSSFKCYVKPSFELFRGTVGQEKESER
jgi:hypothetical protein